MGFLAQNIQRTLRQERKNRTASRPGSQHVAMQRKVQVIHHLFRGSRAAGGDRPHSIKIHIHCRNKINFTLIYLDSPSFALIPAGLGIHFTSIFTQQDRLHLFQSIQPCHQSLGVLAIGQPPVQLIPNPLWQPPYLSMSCHNLMPFLIRPCPRPRFSKL